MSDIDTTVSGKLIHRLYMRTERDRMEGGRTSERDEIFG